MKVTKDSVVCRMRGEEAVVAFRYDRVLTRSEADQVMSDLDALMDEHTCSSVVLDCRALKQVTSVFFGRLVSLHNRLKESEGALKAFGMSRDVAQAFRFCNLDKLIPLFESLAEARAGS